MKERGILRLWQCYMWFIQCFTISKNPQKVKNYSSSIIDYSLFDCYNGLYK